jgi:chemotaxis protein MotB
MSLNKENLKSKTFIDLDSHNVDEHGTWAVSYGDMITLLLTFFIMFFSLDAHQKRDKRMQMLEEELMKTLTGKTEYRHEDLFSKTKRNIAGVDGADKTDVTVEVMNTLGAKIRKVDEYLIVEFPQISFFDFASTEVNETGKRLLENFAKKYVSYAASFKLSVRAFTDFVPVVQGKHRFQDNLELSALRSISAMRVLQRAGIPLKRMRIAGLGELEPSTLRKIANTQDKIEAELSNKNKTSIENENTLIKGDPYSRKVVLLIEPDSKEAI